MARGIWKVPDFTHTQAPDLLLARLTALRFRMALAIGAELGQADRLLLGHEAKMRREDVFAVVLGAGMIDCMRGQGLAVVVDRHVDQAPEGLLRTPRWCRRRQKLSNRSSSARPRVKVKLSRFMLRSLQKNKGEI